MSSSRIAIIGAGWSGLYALKWLKQEGQAEVTVYERSGEVGGVWHLGGPDGVMHSSVHHSSSRLMTQASDYPMPESYPQFPSVEQIHRYLEGYADHFGLRHHIRFNTTVVALRKIGGCWQLTFRRADDGSEQTEEYDRVVVASGQQAAAVDPRKHGSASEQQLWTRFEGTMLHSSEYRSPNSPAIRDKRVLLIGGGESSTNIANDVARESAAFTAISIRRGQWMVDRELSGAHPCDILSARGLMLLGPYGNSPVLRVVQWVHEYLYGHGGTSVPEWNPVDGRKPYMGSNFNACREVIREVIRGEVVPRRGVRAVEGRKVWFDRVSEPLEFDTVIFCTGYKPSMKFLLGDGALEGIPLSAECVAKEGRTNELYGMVFAVEDPTLAFVGTARPHYGPWALLTELQCRWLAAVVHGKTRLPDAAARAADVAAFKEDQRLHFPGDHIAKPNMVNTFAYADALAARFGACLSLWDEYRRSPLEFVFLLSVHYSGLHYLLNDPIRRSDALAALHRNFDRDSRLKQAVYWTFSIFVILVHIFLILFLGFLVGFIL